MTFTLDLEERVRTVQTEKETNIPSREIANAKPYRQKKKIVFEVLDQFELTVMLDDLSGIARDRPR